MKRIGRQGGPLRSPPQSKPGDNDMVHPASTPEVTTALHGPVLVVSIHNPPVNALSAAVRRGLGSVNAN